MTDWLQYGAVGLCGLIIVLLLRPLVQEGVAALRRLVEAFLETQHALLAQHQAATTAMLEQQREAAEGLRATVSGKFDALAGPLSEIASQQRQMTAIWSNGRCPIKDNRKETPPS